MTESEELEYKIDNLQDTLDRDLGSMYEQQRIQNEISYLERLQEEIEDRLGR